MAPRTLTIDHTYFVKAPVRKVFRALSDPEGLSSWFLATARIDARVGGAYDFEWQAGYRHSGTVLAFLRGKKISWSWPNRAGGKLQVTRVTFSVRSHRGGTLVRFRHEGYPRRDPWIEIYGGTEAAWAYFLTNMKSVLEHGHDLRSSQDR
jgi:uncharacterized protein YndB with AHSA1/START domain